MSISVYPAVPLLLLMLSMLQVPSDLTYVLQSHQPLVPIDSSRGQDSVTESRNRSHVEAKPNDGSPERVGLRPHDVTSQTLRVEVQSNGCTNRDSFSVSVNQQGSTTRITLTRLQPDMCRMKPHQIWLEFRWEELGLDGPRAVVVEERDSQ
jgi:hypothetical protein